MTSKKDAVAQLCQTCGLCCDGSLFSVVELEADEECDVGPILQDAKGIRRFVQPCRCFDKVCTIYHARPRACAVYFCDTAKSVNSGWLSLPRGLSRVHLMRAQVDTLRRLSGDKETPVSNLVRRAVDDYRAHRKDPDYSADDRALAAAAFQYRKLKKRYFVSRYKKYLRRFRRIARKLWSRRGSTV